MCICMRTRCYTYCVLLHLPTLHIRGEKKKEQQWGKASVGAREKKVTDGGGFQWEKALEINGRSGAARQHLKRYNPKSNSENPFLLLFHLMCENECRRALQLAGFV